MTRGNGWVLVDPEDFKSLCRALITSEVGSIPTRSRQSLECAMRAWIDRGRRAVALLVALGSLCCAAGARCEPPPAGVAAAHRPSPKGALLRSAAYPGWGQLANGKPYKACVIMAVEAYFVGVAVSAGRRAADAEELAAGASTAAEVTALEEKRARYEDRRNAHLWWLGAAILYSMLDAYVDASLAGVGEKGSEPPVSLRLRSGSPGDLGLAVVAKF
jgi:hypothetical protein